MNGTKRDLLHACHRTGGAVAQPKAERIGGSAGVSRADPSSESVPQCLRHPGRGKSPSGSSRRRRETFSRRAPRAAAWSAVFGKGRRVYRRAAHNGRVPHLRALRSGKGCHRGRAAPGRRRHFAGENQHPGIRLQGDHRKPSLRSDVQSLGHDAYRRRVKRRRRGRHGGRPVAAFCRHGRRGLHSYSREFLRRLRAEAHVWPHPRTSGIRRLENSLSHRPDRSNGARWRSDVRRHVRTSRARSPFAAGEPHGLSVRAGPPEREPAARI